MVKLYCKTVGMGPHLVLLHGWGTHSDIWQFCATKLADHFTVTLIDLPGFGRSDDLSDYNLDTIAKLLLDVAPSPAIWLGWSLGGLVATQFAYLYPERVLKLISVASSPKFLAAENWGGMKLSILQKFNDQLGVDYEGTIQRFILLQFYGSTPNKEMIRWLNANLFLYSKPSHKTLNDGLALLKNVDLRHELTKLHCPVLYMLGHLDALVPVTIATQLQTYNQHVQTVVFSKASHALFLSHQDEFITEVNRFANN